MRFRGRGFFPYLRMFLLAGAARWALSYCSGSKIPEASRDWGKAGLRDAIWDATLDHNTTLGGCSVAESVTVLSVGCWENAQIFSKFDPLARMPPPPKLRRPSPAHQRKAGTKGGACFGLRCSTRELTRRARASAW